VEEVLTSSRRWFAAVHLVAFGPKAKRRHERAADRVVRRKLVGIDAELAQHAADAARLGVEILLHRVQRADLSCPGRSAAPLGGALQTRDPGSLTAARTKPGSRICGAALRAAPRAGTRRTIATFVTPRRDRAQLQAT
jgi:hypothetical protein